MADGSESLGSVIYLSTATKLMTPAELAELLDDVRPVNHAAALTGLLLYSSGSFIQVLEGPIEALEITYASIEADPRHHGLVEAFHGHISERMFPRWSMGFRDLGDLDVTHLDGFQAFNADARASVSEAEHTRRVEAFFSAFRKMSA